MAAPTAHTAAPAEHTSFPPFQSQNFPSQLLWLTVTFVVLYFLMAKVALPRIGGIIADRSKRISDDIAEANRLKERSDAAHAAYEKELADAHGRAQAIANATHEKHRAEAEATNKRLESELHERLGVAEASIAQTRQTAMGHVGAIAAETASAIVQHLIGTTPTERDVTAAVETVKH